MNTDRKLIIGLIAIVVIILAGILIFAPTTQNQTQTAYEIPLKTQGFSYFEMATPENSNFAVQNNNIEVGKGIVTWQNKGNFSNETDFISISKGYTDKVIPEKMKLISNNNSEKVYMSENLKGNYYKVVKTVNDTDIIVSGYNLPLLEKMLNTTKIKDTSKLTLKEPVANKTVENKTPVQKTDENKTPIEKTTEPKVEKTVEDKTPVEKVIEQKNEDKKQAEKAAEPKVETTVAKEPLMIGGGSFSTGSDDADKTYANIYVGKDHAGEKIGMKILYSRDGTNLNTGNYVTATVEPTGYVSISSADAYSKYPDFAYVELYDDSGDLKSTQGIRLNPTSGTQYF